MEGEQTKTARHGQPRVGNDSGGRVDAEEWAHGRGEHAGAREGSAVDLGDGELVMEIGWTSGVKRGRAVGVLAA